MAKLTTNVVLSHPNGSVEFLPEGSTLPGWAAGLVGDHALDHGDAGWASLKVDDLRAAIAERNEGREESEQIVPEGTRKDDLVAALVADDNR